MSDLGRGGASYPSRRLTGRTATQLIGLLVVALALSACASGTRGVRVGSVTVEDDDTTLEVTATLCPAVGSEQELRIDERTDVVELGLFADPGAGLCVWVGEARLRDALGSRIVIDMLDGSPIDVEYRSAP